LRQFVGIVGMVALLLGGIGVASGVHAFVARKIDTVAILRCLGATGQQVLTMYVAQAAVMGIAGAVLGAILGVRRQSVGLIEDQLQKAGLIRYSRGKMSILDSVGLQRVACECYKKVKEELDRYVLTG
jgi:cell division protein FtsX